MQCNHCTVCTLCLFCLVFGVQVKLFSSCAESSGAVPDAILKGDCVAIMYHGNHMQAAVVGGGDTLVIDSDNALASRGMDFFAVPTAFH